MYGGLRNIMKSEAVFLSKYLQLGMEKIEKPIFCNIGLLKYDVLWQNVNVIEKYLCKMKGVLK